MKRRLFLFLFIAGLLLVLGTIAAACGDDDGDESDEDATTEVLSDEDAITEVLEEMVAALNDRDFEALAPLITANAFLDTEPAPEALQEALENAEATLGPFPQIEGFKIIEVVIMGDGARAIFSAEVAGETDEATFPLVKQDGRWLVDGIPGL